MTLMVPYRRRRVINTCCNGRLTTKAIDMARNLKRLIGALAISIIVCTGVQAATSRPSFVVSDIYNYNHPYAATDSGDLATKMQLMSASAFYFYRGTADIFIAIRPRCPRRAIPPMPRVSPGSAAMRIFQTSVPSAIAGVPQRLPRMISTKVIWVSTCGTCAARR